MMPLITESTFWLSLELLLLMPWREGLSVNSCAEGVMKPNANFLAAMPGLLVA